MYIKKCILLYVHLTLLYRTNAENEYKITPKLQKVRFIQTVQLLYNGKNYKSLKITNTST